MKISIKYALYTKLISRTLFHRRLLTGALVSMSLITATTLSGCTSTTSTGTLGVDRKQMMMVSRAQVQQLSSQSYSKRLAKARQQGVLDTDNAMRARLQSIANRIIPQVSVYRPDATSWNWEVHTIKSDSVNAFVLPGGKVMFYTGIVDKLGLTDDEIAAIMGHEMAHALREHSRERLSSAYAKQMGLGLLVGGLGLSRGQAQLASIAGDLAVSRPHSRVQESEADVVGLELMARAGYKPDSSITLWKKMQQAGGGGVPRFLSTHPSSVQRMNKLNSLIPQVMPLYHQAKGGSPSLSTSPTGKTFNGSGSKLETFQP